MAANAQGQAVFTMDPLDPPAEEEGAYDGNTSLTNKMAAAVGQTIAGNVLESGKESAKTLYQSYARIDLLRPYFDVEPADVRNRLLQSLRPRLGRDPQVIHGDLYGPIMCALTLVAVLLLGMKSAVHTGTVRQGTIIGTAFAVVFGYWLTSSAVFYGISFIFNTSLTVVELLSTTGYGLFAYNLVLLASHVRHSSTDFYIAWGLIGSLSAARMAMVFRSRTHDKKQGLILGVVVGGFHLFYLLYMQYAYASVYRAVEEAI